MTFRDRLRPDGVLFMAVPDMRHTFDRSRPLTTLDHLVADHIDGPDRSRRGHYEEYVRHVADLSGADGEALVERLLQSKYSIHFHTFTPASLGRLYDHCQLELTASLSHDDEVITVVRT